MADSSWLRRHTKPLIVVSSLLALGYVSVASLKTYLLGLQSKHKITKHSTALLHSKFTNINHLDFNAYLLSILPDLHKNIFDLLSPEHLAFTLQHSSKLNKSQCWRDIKILTFTRLFLCFYCVSLLSTLSKIQLNILGRRQYLNSILFVPLSNTHPIPNTATDSAFLTLSWYFLHVGWRQCATLVQSAVESVLSSVPLKREISKPDFILLVADIRHLVETNESFTSMMFPLNAHEQHSTLQSGGQTTALVCDQLQAMIDETLDVLDSPHVAVALRACTQTVFDLGMHQLLDFFEADRVPFASILPHARLLAHTVVQDEPSNIYVSTVNNVDELYQLSMLVFTQFSNVCVE